MIGHAREELVVHTAVQLAASIRRRCLEAIRELNLDLVMRAQAVGRTGVAASPFA
jgi:hypothetical protein